jgi:ribonuclease P protein component
LLKEIIIEQRFTFKKEEKLKSHKLIELLFKQGTSFSIFPLRILYLFPGNNIALLQAGFAVSTKNFKKAVDRNKVKRLMREVYRKQKSELFKTLHTNEKYMIVFFIYTGKEIPNYNYMLEKMQSGLKRLSKISDEKSVTNP